MDADKTVKLGSLFDGIGGFPYAGSFFGIKPAWASEILPQAVSVTKRHFPDMQHVGDITQLGGATLPPTEIITFGSPCQDLSTAGKRAGIGGSRSNLFYEAIRIIDEMRDATNGQYPKYAVWENVPGALSSGHPRGSDFRAVLEAFTKTEVPMPDSGNWANAGLVRGGGVAVAWRILNAALWGVPQRRRRIFLIASFGAGCPGEILFVEEGLRRHFAPGGQAWQGTAADAQRGSGGAMRGFGGGYIDTMLFAANQRDEVRDLGAASGALQAQPGMKQRTFVAQNSMTPWDVQSRRVHGDDGAWPALYGEPGGGHGYTATLQKPDGGVRCLTPWETQQSRIFTGEGNSPTLAGADGGGGRNPGGLVAAFCGGASADARSIGYSEKVSPTLKAEAGGFTAPCVCEPQTARTLTARGDGSPNIDSGPNVVAFGITSQSANSMRSANPHSGIYEADASKTLDTSGVNPSANQGGLAIVLTCAVGVHQNQAGDVNVSETAYTLNTNSNATGRNAPLVAHPEVAGTLCASGAGLSRPAGMASEPDLCVAYALAGNMIGRQDSNGPQGSGVREDVSFTLNATDVQGVAAVNASGEPIPIHDRATRCQGGGDTRNGDGCGNGLGVGKPGDPAPTLSTGDHHMVAAVFNRQRSDEFKEQDIASTQAARQFKDATDLVCEGEVSAVDCRNYKEIGDCSGTLQAKDKPGYSLNYQNPVRLPAEGTRYLSQRKERVAGGSYIVRRLTPTECERLQGYPDGWTLTGDDGKEISDTRRYQMLGNSICVPVVAFVLGSIAAQMREEVVADGLCARR